MKSMNPVVNMALNLADRRKPGVNDTTVNLRSDTYDRNFNIKASAIKETCHLHDTFLREWLGHIGKGAQADAIIKKIEKDGIYEGSFMMKHTFVITA